MYGCVHCLYRILGYIIVFVYALVFLSGFVNCGSVFVVRVSVVEV